MLGFDANAAQIFATTERGRKLLHFEGSFRSIFFETFDCFEE